MHIDPANALSSQALPLYQRDYFPVSGVRGCRKAAQQAQNLATLPQPAQRQLTDHEGVREHPARVEQLRKGRAPAPQMFNPNGSVDERQRRARRAGDLRRRVSRMAGSLPASAARRRALSRAIRASSPARRSAVF